VGDLACAVYSERSAHIYNPIKIAYDPRRALAEHAIHLTKVNPTGRSSNTKKSETAWFFLLTPTKRQLTTLHFDQRGPPQSPTNCPDSLNKTYLHELARLPQNPYAPLDRVAGSIFSLALFRTPYITKLRPFHLHRSGAFPCP